MGASAGTPGLATAGETGRFSDARRNTARWSPDLFEIMRRLAGEGYSAAQIAKEIGRSRSAIIGKCHRHGIDLNGSSAGPREKTAAPRKPKQTRLYKAWTPPPPPTPSPIVPAVEADAPASRNVPFLDTKRGEHCLWITSSDGEPVTCCGHQAVGAGPWCAHHAHVAHQPRRGPQGPFVNSFGRGERKPAGVRSGPRSLPPAGRPRA